MMTDIRQSATYRGRRLFLRRAAILGAGLLVPSVVLGKSDPLFDDGPDDLTGPLSRFAKEIASKAKSMLKPGRYAQELYEEFQKGDDEARLKLYALAESGDAYARTTIGWMLDNGVGARKSSFKAASYFQLAAPEVQLARYNLGVLLLHGRGVAQDIAKAMEYFGEAPRIAPAMVQLARYALQEGKGNTALHFAEKAARLHDPMGMYLQAPLLLAKGEERQGAMIMRRAATADVPDAITSMVVVYEKGLGVTKDAGLAAGWWIVDQVLIQGHTLEESEAAIERFNLSKADKNQAIRFARKWLLKRVAAQQFDYTKTLNFLDVRRI